MSDAAEAVVLWRSLTDRTRSYLLSMSYHVLDAQKTLSGDLRDLYANVCTLIGVKNDIDRSTALAVAMTYDLSFVEVMMKIPTQLYCYHNKNDKKVRLVATLRESLEDELGVVVMEGALEGYTRPLVVKWYQGDHFTISHELNMYNTIAMIDPAILPWFSTSYSVWTDPVLVMELLTVLDDTDHEDDVGVSVLKKLKKIHTVCIHCDIKPNNIVKNTDTGNYYLIDFGQSTTLNEREGKMHRRHVRTKKYNRGGYKHITTIKTDLVELLYSLRMIQIRRLGEKHKHEDLTTGYKGNLRAFSKILDGVGEYPDGDIYDRLITALSS